MEKDQPTKKTLGQRLVSQLERELIEYNEACTMFINQVSIEAIPTELEALPTAFKSELEKYISLLPIGTPEWDSYFMIGGLYYFGTMSTDEHMKLVEGIAKKNKMTAEELQRYFQTHRASDVEA